MENSKSLGREISLISRCLRTYLDRELRKLSLGSGHFFLLMALYSREGESQKFLSDRLGIDKGTTARLIRKLEELNLVEVKDDPEDKRINRVFLTKKGRELKGRFKKLSDKFSREALKGFTEKEKILLFSLLEKIYENILHFRSEV